MFIRTFKLNMTQSDKRKGRTTDMWHSIARTKKRNEAESIMNREINESENNDIEGCKSDSEYYSISESDDSNDSDTTEKDGDEKEEGKERDKFKQEETKVEEMHEKDNLEGRRQGEKIRQHYQ